MEVVKEIEQDMKTALDYVKWPTASKMSVMIRRADFEEQLAIPTKRVISDAIRGMNSKDSVFALGEMLVKIHADGLTIKDTKKKEHNDLRYEYVQLVYDQLFERIL